MGQGECDFGLVSLDKYSTRFFENMAQARHIILSDGASTGETVATVNLLRPGTTVLTNEIHPGVP